MTSDDTRRPVVILGQALAAAQEEERARQRALPLESSPIPRLTYDPWQGDYDLLRPVRRALDDAIAAVCDQFAVPGTDRSAWRRRISMEEIYTLLMFSQRAVVFALRASDLAFLRDAAIAISMVELSRADERDVALAIFMVSHIGAALGDADGPLRAAAELAEPPVADPIAGALRHQRQSTLHDQCGYDVVNTPSGLGLVRRGFEVFHPRGDLLALGLQLVSIIEADMYGNASLELATALPAVWLRPATEKEIAAHLRECRAGLTVTARLRLTTHASVDSHRLWAFVQELSEPKHASSLAALSRLAHRGDTRVLGLSSGAVFALLVAASTVSAVPEYEGPGSLNRFTASIQTALDDYARHVI